MRFFLEKRTQNQGYYRNLEFFRLFLHEVHNLEKSHIYQDFISETLFWENHQKNALFRKITLIFGAFFFLEKRTQNQRYYRNLEFFGCFFMRFTIWKKSHINQDFICIANVV